MIVTKNKINANREEKLKNYCIILQKIKSNRKCKNFFYENIDNSTRSIFSVEEDENQFKPPIGRKLDMMNRNHMRLAFSGAYLLKVETKPNFTLK